MLSTREPLRCGWLPGRSAPILCPPGDANAVNAAGRIAVVLGSVWALAAFTVTGCTFQPPRNPASDFFIKDYNLPEYRPDVAEFTRERHSVTPDESSGALGGMLGATMGGRRKAWEATASGSLGGLTGSLVGKAFADAETSEPLPEDYEGFALALPVIVTNPNRGPTVGVLPVVVLQESARITTIFAPDVTYNDIDGVGGTFRMLRYFSDDAKLTIDAGSTSEGYHDYKVVYDQRRIGPNRLVYFRARFSYFTDLSERFYGLGNGTVDDAESSYVFRRTTAEATIGGVAPFGLKLEFSELIKTYDVGPGRLTPDVPSTKKVFPSIRGVSDGPVTLLNHRIRLTYDGRDNEKMPTEGVYGQFVYDVADDSLGSSFGFQRFHLDLAVYIPLADRRFVTVGRFAGWIMTGNKIPFFEMTQLGGKTTIRGYGQGRFVERDGYVANIEQRARLFEIELLGNRIALHVAAFADVGRVFAPGDPFTLRQSKVAFGGAVRLIVPDSNLVTSIDMGFSREGSAVFVSLDYPF